MCILFFWTDVNVYIANKYTYNAEIYSYEPENVHVLVAAYNILHAVLRNMLRIMYSLTKMYCYTMVLIAKFAYHDI